MKGGFFTMEDARHIAGLKDLSEAKTYANSRIDAQPKALPGNVAKAKSAVAAATSVPRLTMAISNFVLAHPSEGLKVI